ncbi:hypothetical protein ACRARG_18250 [Pseudooceanicola sp. C21-150M6]|uniref:hypothetical protein n=1 Tax=Pseudooceanicola sp. C21-150M6 TaxID=3434355 RepID=UPI003D7F9F25
MTLCYFVLFFHPEDPELRIDPEEAAALRSCLTVLLGLTRASLYRPATARDSLSDDGAPPVFGMQLYFEDLASLEAAVNPGPGTTLCDFVRAGGLDSLAGTDAAQQAMYLRPFDVPEPRAPGPDACSYIVYYPGPAEDLTGWLDCYLRQHPPLMLQFPGLRELEILTRLDWIDAMPWPRVHFMQRNRVMFDSPEALTAALHSPVRIALRDDSASFPPIEGGNRHYPMLTEVIRPGGATG